MVSATPKGGGSSKKASRLNRTKTASHKSPAGQRWFVVQQGSFFVKWIDRYGRRGYYSLFKQTIRSLRDYIYFSDPAHAKTITLRATSKALLLDRVLKKNHSCGLPGEENCTVEEKTAPFEACAFIPVVIYMFRYKRYNVLMPNTLKLYPLKTSSRLL